MAKQTKAHSHGNGQTTAIISYITLIGTIIAIIINQNEKDSFARFHIRQALLLNLSIWVVSFIASWFWFIGGFLSGIIMVIGIIAIVVGIIKASSGEEYQMPVIGGYAQEWFKGL